MTVFDVFGCLALLLALGASLDFSQRPQTKRRVVSIIIRFVRVRQQDVDGEYEARTFALADWSFTRRAFRDAIIFSAVAFSFYYGGRSLSNQNIPVFSTMPDKFNFMAFSVIFICFFVCAFNTWLCLIKSSMTIEAAKKGAGRVFWLLLFTDTLATVFILICSFALSLCLAYVIVGLSGPSISLQYSVSPGLARAYLGQADRKTFLGDNKGNDNVAVDELRALVSISDTPTDASLAQYARAVRREELKPDEYGFVQYNAHSECLRRSDRSFSLPDEFGILVNTSLTLISAMHAGHRIAPAATKELGNLLQTEEQSANRCDLFVVSVERKIDARSALRHLGVISLFSVSLHRSFTYFGNAIFKTGSNTIDPFDDFKDALEEAWANQSMQAKSVDQAGRNLRNLIEKSGYEPSNSALLYLFPVGANAFLAFIVSWGLPIGERIWRLNYRLRAVFHRLLPAVRIRDAIFTNIALTIVSFVLILYLIAFALTSFWTLIFA